MSMKRILYFTLAAATLLLFSCSKDSSVKPGNGSSETVKNSVTISVDIPKEGLSTKISFAEDGDKRLTKIAWEDDDVIDVYDGTTHNPFTIASISADGKTATFTGNEPAVASSYVITYNSLGSNLNTQLQNGDGTTGHLGYKVVKTVSDYKTVSFAGATIQSSVLQLRALLPDAIKNNVAKVIFKSNLAVFNEQKELTVALADGTLDANDRLDVYASIPEGDITLPDDMELLIQFQVSANAYDKYTAYRTFTSGTELFKSGGSQYIGINCSNILSFANASDASIGSATNPYLVGDQNQWKAISLSGTKQYYKLVDDIDMTGVTTSLNAAGTGVIGLDGNSKVLRNLEAPLFDDLNGSVADLTIADSEITVGGSVDAGILANTIKTAASTVNNVDISNCSITTGRYAGGLICNITVANSTISNVNVVNTNIISTSLAGGIIGFPQRVTSITNCHFIGNGTSSAPATKGVITPSNQYAGGICGATTANYAVTIDGCSVRAAKIASSYNRVGGAIGHLRSGSSVNNTVVGEDGNPVVITMTTTGMNVGGFIGLMEGGEVTDCTSYVSLTGVKPQTGGFIGQMNGGIVTGSKSYGDVSGTEKIGGFFGEVLAASSVSGNESHCAVTANSTYVGGFVGHLAGSVSVSNCKHVDGKVSSNLGNNNSVYVGGFAGYIGLTDEAFTGTISGCFVNNAEVTSFRKKTGSDTADSSGKWVGGFAGGIGHSTSANNTGKLEKCGVYNTSVAGNQYTGGFAGVSYSTIEKCRVNGKPTVQAYSSAAGGFNGFQNGNSVSYCYTNAVVRHADKSNVGGLIGDARNMTVTECYASGNVNSSSTSNNAATNGGMIGKTSSVTLNRLIRWNNSNNATIVGGETSTPVGCHVKTSSETDFHAAAVDLGWSNDGTIWSYPTDGGIPTLVGV